MGPSKAYHFEDHPLSSPSSHLFPSSPTSPSSSSSPPLSLSPPPLHRLTPPSPSRLTTWPLCRWREDADNESSLPASRRRRHMPRLNEADTADDSSGGGGRWEGGDKRAEEKKPPWTKDDFKEIQEVSFSHHLTLGITNTPPTLRFLVPTHAPDARFPLRFFHLYPQPSATCTPSPKTYAIKPRALSQTQPNSTLEPPGPSGMTPSTQNPKP